MGKRYRLKGTDIEVKVLEMGWMGVPPGMTWINLHGHRMATFRGNLEEVPPPGPAEPEPGVYLIGGVPCWHDEAYGWWLGRNHGDGSIWRGVWRDWAEVWQTIGGPDVDIVPLVAKPAAVELPWRGGSGGTEITVGVSGTVSLTKVIIDGASGWQFVLGINATREMGWALLSAADRAEAGE